MRTASRQPHKALFTRWVAALRRRRQQARGTARAVQPLPPIDESDLAQRVRRSGEW